MSFVIAHDVSFTFNIFRRPKGRQEIMGSMFSIKNLFLTILLPKTLRKHYKHLDKLIHCHKKYKKIVKKQNQPEVKIILPVIPASSCKERKKTLRSNFSHEMKLIDTKIYYFCGQNLR